MIVAAHQPAYLPWLGYLDKMAKCDVFVVMDDLPFEPRNFQNRNRIAHERGPAWLTVPVHDTGERIVDKLVDNSPRGEDHWQHRTWRTLVSSYRHAPYFNRYVDDLRFVFMQPWRRLVDLDIYMLDLARRWLKIQVPIVRSSTLDLVGDDVTDRLIQVCKKVGARAYLSGSGNATKTLDAERIGRAGLGVIWQVFDHPTYPQACGDGSGSFTSNLGFVDLLFNCGPASRETLFGRGHPIHCSGRVAA